jgi:hypothetical protein
MNNIKTHCHEKFRSTKIKITLREILPLCVEKFWTDHPYAEEPVGEFDKNVHVNKCFVSIKFEKLT